MVEAQGGSLAGLWHPQHPWWMGPHFVLCFWVSLLCKPLPPPCPQILRTQSMVSSSQCSFPHGMQSLPQTYWETSILLSGKAPTVTHCPRDSSLLPPSCPMLSPSGPLTSIDPPEWFHTLSVKSKMPDSFQSSPEAREVIKEMAKEKSHKNGTNMHTCVPHTFSLLICLPIILLEAMVFSVNMSIEIGVLFSLTWKS